MSEETRRVAEEIVRKYPALISELIQVDALDEEVVISLPFLDLHRDAIEVRMRVENGHVMLSDNGELLAGLAFDGVKVRPGTRRHEAYQELARRHRLSLENGKVLGRCPLADAPHLLHEFVHFALSLRAQPLFALRGRIETHMHQVAELLRASKVPVEENVRLRGISGVAHLFHLKWPFNGRYVVARVLPHPTVRDAELFAFALIDVRGQTSRVEYEGLALLAPGARPVQGFKLIADRYKIRTVDMADREALLSLATP